MLNFKVGHYYVHEGGRKAHILAAVDTTTFGKQYLIEFADETGFSLELGSEMGDAPFSKIDVEKLGWIEIGKSEWMSMLKSPVCCMCGGKFKNGENTVPTFKGPAHAKCFSDRVVEQADIMASKNPTSPNIVGLN